jgi:hypothetical protein
VGAAVYNGVGLGTGTGYAVPVYAYNNGWFALVSNTPLAAAGLCKNYPLAAPLAGRTQINTALRVGMRRVVLPFSTT